jgi:hypothetical protein
MFGKRWRATYKARTLSCQWRGASMVGHCVARPYDGAFNSNSIPLLELHLETLACPTSFKMMSILYDEYELIDVAEKKVNIITLDTN